MLLARDHIEARGGVAAIWAIFGIAFALLGNRMNEHRPIRPRLDSAQNRKQLIHIMPINRADVIKAQFFEQGAADCRGFQQFFRAARPVLERLGQKRYCALGGGFEFLKRRACIKAGQIGRHRTCWRCNRHFIVVEDHNQPLFQMARIVQGLIGHACGNRTITDNRNRISQTCLAGTA